MKQEQIIKALECCDRATSCGGCTISKKCEGIATMITNALSLIRELTKENERLKAENAEQDEAIIKALQRMGEVRRETQSDTVRKMQDRLKSRIADLEYRANVKRKTVSVETLLEQVSWILHEIVPTKIDQIAKEMLEETDEQSRRKKDSEGA